MSVFPMADASVIDATIKAAEHAAVIALILL